MNNIKITAEIILTKRPKETEEELRDRLYDLMWDGLCNAADHQCDFWIITERFE